jgi:DNA-binding HxlR family transcriptional regulator
MKDFTISDFKRRLLAESMLGLSDISSDINAIKRKASKIRAPVITKRVTSSGSMRIIKRYDYEDIPEKMLPRDEPTIDDIEKVLKQLSSKSKGYSIKITIGDGKKKKISTKYRRDSDDAVKELIGNIEKNSSEYSGSVFGIDVFIIELLKNDRFVGAGGRSWSAATKVWKIVSHETKTNCAPISLLTCIDYLNGEFNVDKTLLVKRATKIKRKVGNKLTKDYTPLNEIDYYAEYLKHPVIVYDNLFNKVTQFYHQPKSHHTKKRAPLEIQITGGHWVSLIRWKDLPQDMYVEQKPRIEIPAELPDDGEVKFIKKALRKCPERNDKFASYDIEAYPDPENDDAFKVYALGFTDGIVYVSFWGENAVAEWFDWLYERREIYKDYTFYAHNGGKFDSILLVQHYLLNGVKWVMNTETEKGAKAICLDGRWLNITIRTRECNKCKINFRDSCAIIQGSLDKITKDFDVLHKKLTELVDHESINKHTYNTYRTTIETYLEHDVKGLYEVLEKFDDIVWNLSYRQINCKEDWCHNVVEHITGMKWQRNKRPQWLKGLELDMWLPEHNIALEYQGEQHYKECRMNKFDVKPQQYRDETKRQVCMHKGIKLLEVPYTLQWKEIPAYIYKLLPKNLRINEPDYESIQYSTQKFYALNMTDCLTAASLAKKLFYQNYYKPWNPIAVLPKSIDRYLRRYYFGGRVEVLSDILGEQPEGNYYYYDYTSLYPAMCVHDLPYGEPVVMKDIAEIERQIRKGKFFGFVRAMVKHKKEFLEQEDRDRPLHAYQDCRKGRLLFKYHVAPVEMVLFSEELRDDMYDYDIIDAVKFERAPIMKGFATDLFKKKSEAKKNGQSAIELTFKIIVNSGYGFWGLNTSGRDGVEIYPRGEAPVRMKIDNEEMVQESDIGDYTILRTVRDLDVTDHNVSVAMAITSYARYRLWELMSSIESKGYKVLYCDTDSIITTCKLSEHKDLMKEFMPDGTGDALGSLKNEISDKAKKMARKGTISLDGVEDVHDLPANRLCLNGLKYYSIANDKLGIDISKCKGYTQKTEQDHLDYKKIATGKIEQAQKQFKCGVSSYCCERDPWSIKLKSVQKVVEKSYTKATLLNGRLATFES